MKAVSVPVNSQAKQATLGLGDQGFLELLPRITRYARYAARHLHAEARDELVAEVVASGFVTYRRLCDLGLSHLIYASALARFAVAQARCGRRVGSSLNGRDALSEYAQRSKQFSVTSLEQFDAQRGAWREVAVEDRRWSPAQVASFRLDFAAWLLRLTPRQRAVAQLLSVGESTKTAAQRCHISPARVSQVRRELERSWRSFQDEPCRSRWSW